MKISAVNRGGDKFNFRFPECLGNEMDDAVFNLKSSGNSQKIDRLCQHGITTKNALPHNNVHKTGFIFQGHEDDTAGSSGPLAADYQPGVTNALAIFPIGYGTSVGKSLADQSGTQRFKRVATRAV